MSCIIEYWTSERMTRGRACLLKVGEGQRPIHKKERRLVTEHSTTRQAPFF